MKNSDHFFLPVRRKTNWAKVDALQENDIDHFLQQVISENGKLDVVFNGIGVSYDEMGGRPATTTATLQQFMAPMEKLCGSQFLTSRVAARYMIQSQSEGTILLLTAALSSTDEAGAGKGIEEIQQRAAI